MCCGHDQCACLCPGDRGDPPGVPRRARRCRAAVRLRHRPGRPGRRPDRRDGGGAGHRAPDLVLVERSAAEHLRELSAIAPTVVVERASNAAWKAAFDATVDVADRAAGAEQVRERYRSALAAVPDAARGRSVTFLRGQGDGAFRIDGSGAFGGSVAAEAGLTVRDGAGRGEPSEHGHISFGVEELPVADGDLLVVPDRAGGPSSVGNLMANPLWERLPAVRANRVLPLPNAVYNGGTYLGAELLLRELSAALG
ncbi:ABC transporter substrate-binding protein [Pseudonocardia sp. NPDC046786]|uniref:ABC transporter substrate-binding protein n=1 Tax=Pseudonocardia sp. NPDC046786 TaxID=3155471 RepID=UPI0034092954